jgi:hypothetical protein
MVAEKTGLGFVNPPVLPQQLDTAPVVLFGPPALVQQFTSRRAG